MTARPTRPLILASTSAYRRQLLERHGELPLFNTAVWVGHLEALLERLLNV